MTTKINILNSSDHPVGTRILVTTNPYQMYPGIPSAGAQETYVEEWAPEQHVKLRLPLHDNVVFWLLAPTIKESHVLSVLSKTDFANVSSPTTPYSDSGTLRIALKTDPETGIISRYLQYRATINTTSTTGIVGMPVTKYSEWMDVPVIDEANL